nr:hypothetical protein [Tanacetum cinerariifolium]
MSQSRQDVIEFGDSNEAPQEESSTGSASESSAKKKGRIVAITTEHMQKMRNDVKARTTLLLALPDEHQLRFKKYKTAQDLWGAILKIFGGNKATKKTKKNQLKQQYGNFKAEGSEILKQTFNRLHIINMAFISSAKHNSGKGEVNTASILTASTHVSPASADVTAASINHDTVCAYIASQSNSSQIKYEDINQIDKDDIEEIDIKGRRENYKQGSKVEESAPKALMAIDGVGWDWSYMANEEENHALVADDEAPTEFALISKSSSSSENEVFDDSLCFKSCKKNTDSLSTKITNLNEALSDSKTNLYHYKLGLSQVEARLVEFKTQEIKLCEKIRGLEFDVKNKNIKIENLMNELEQIKKEKEGLDSKLTGFESASKDIDTRLGSQRSNKNKEGLGYSAVPPSCSSLFSSQESIESNTSDLENSNSSIFEHRESSKSIISKPMIKFVKAADCAKVKTNKAQAARKPSIKYAKMYINTSKRPKGEVNTTSIPIASTHVSPASADVAGASISHDTICAYIASQSNGSQIKYKDINQIDKDDIEEMDIKWNMALLRWDWSYMANEEENHALVADDEALTEFALMAKSSSSSKNEITKDKEGLGSKLTSFESASKDLDTLLGSQRSDKSKEGLGYSVVPPSCSSLLSFQ